MIDTTVCPWLDKLSVVMHIYEVSTCMSPESALPLMEAWQYGALKLGNTVKICN